MNISQLANYYVNLGVYSINSSKNAKAADTESLSQSAASGEDKVSISDAGRTLTALSSTLTEVRGLVDLATQPGISDDLRSQISDRVSNLLKSIDESLKNDDGSSLNSVVDLSSVATSKDALAVIDEGLATIDGKRRELGIYSGDYRPADSGGASSTRRVSSLSEEEVASLIKALNSQSGSANSQISVLLNSIGGKGNSAISGLYSLL